MQNQVYGLLMKFFKQPNKQIIQFILKNHFFYYKRFLTNVLHDPLSIQPFSCSLLKPSCQLCPSLQQLTQKKKKMLKPKANLAEGKSLGIFKKTHSTVLKIKKIRLYEK